MSKGPPWPETPKQAPAVFTNFLPKPYQRLFAKMHKVCPDIQCMLLLGYTSFRILPYIIKDMQYRRGKISFEKLPPDWNGIPWQITDGRRVGPSQLFFWLWKVRRTYFPSVGVFSQTLYIRRLFFFVRFNVMLTTY